jgi:hypothetical protein
MARHSTANSRDPDEVDVLEKGRGRPVRYLVSWLPWLSLLSWFRDEREAGMGKEKRWSEYSGVPQEREKDKRDFAQPPRREGENWDEVALQGGSAVRHGETV